MRINYPQYISFLTMAFTDELERISEAKDIKTAYKHADRAEGICRAVDVLADVMGGEAKTGLTALSQHWRKGPDGISDYLYDVRGRLGLTTNEGEG